MSKRRCAQKSIAFNTSKLITHILQSPELEAILAPIRLAQERSSYAALLSPPPTLSRPVDLYGHEFSQPWDFATASHSTPSFKLEWEGARRELSAVANVLASMGAVSTAVFWAAGTAPLVQVRTSHGDRSEPRLILLNTENSVSIVGCIGYSRYRGVSVCSLFRTPHSKATRKENNRFQGRSLTPIT